jgi:glutaminase
MYDYSGEWACRVDIPAQSGVGGGGRACSDLSGEPGLHAFHFMNNGSNFLVEMI